MEPLYDQMNKIRLLKQRIEWGKYTLADLEYLKKVLNDVVEGRDANDAFNIQTVGKGVKRSDYAKYRQIAKAFHIITCALDKTVFVEHEGRFYEDGTKKNKNYRLKEALNIAEALTGLSTASLARYWTMDRYQSLKQVCMDEDWL